jgi:hypothetical protein
MSNVSAAARATLGSAHHIRPYCAAFKPLMLLEAMEQLRLGDYVVWADSSKYHNYSRLLQAAEVPSVTDAIAALRDAGVEGGAYGLMACAPDCPITPCLPNSFGHGVSAATLRGFRAHVAHENPNSVYPADWHRDEALLRMPHILDSNILLQVNDANKGLVREWREMAVRCPWAWCGSHPQDQTAWTILTRAVGVPLVDVCAKLVRPPRGTQNFNDCHAETKDLNTFLRALATRRFSVIPARAARTKTCIANSINH